MMSLSSKAAPQNLFASELSTPNETLWQRYKRIRWQSECLASPLSDADAQLQSMADASPCKWHLAHTTWFFETFVLCVHQAGYKRVNELYNYLFNSYYNGIGEQYPRHQRGLISRPSLQEILAYRYSVDSAMFELLEQTDSRAIVHLVELGLQHEQQHQELILTDIKHALFQNPVFPVYRSGTATSATASPMQWLALKPALTELGHGGDDFCFDNERPVHKAYLHGFQLASRLVTNGEFLMFMEAGGYDSPEYWLSDGWAWLQQQKQQKQQSPQQQDQGHCPLYWVKVDDEWFEFSLHGLIPLDLNQAVIHINYYEAIAYANYLGLRLPTEFEWEYAIRQSGIHPLEHGIALHSQASEQTEADIAQVFSCAWQWTSSNYGAYPGFKPFAGAAGEYNGKFMSNQQVLRGSSCVTPAGHSRISYRNFFYPHQRWQFAGIRLATS